MGHAPVVPLHAGPRPVRHRRSLVTQVCQFLRAQVDAETGSDGHGHDSATPAGLPHELARAAAEHPSGGPWQAAGVARATAIDRWFVRFPDDSA